MRTTISLAFVASLAAGGCSVLFDGSSHTSGGGGPDGGADAGSTGCASHEECLARPESVFVCADRGDGARCHELCEGDGECAGHPDGLLCLGGFCGCGAAADCPSGYCDVDDGICVECRADADCPVGAPTCDDEGFCIFCIDDLDCDDADQPACETDSGRCVPCVDPDDCSAGETCSPSFQCVSAECDEDMDGFNADRPGCVGAGEVADCDDTDPGRFPGNTPICGDSQVQGCPDAVVSAALLELGVAEIGRLPSVEVGNPTVGSTMDQLTIAHATPGLGAGSPDAFIVWHETPSVASPPSAVTFHGYNFDGSSYASRTMDTDGVCSSTLSLLNVRGARIADQGAGLYLATTGRAMTGTGAPGAYVAFFRVDPQRDFIEGVGGSTRCRAIIDGVAPATEPGLLDIGVPAMGGLIDFDVGTGAFFRTVELLNTASEGVDAVPMGGSASFPLDWMESSGRFVFGASEEASRVSGGAVGHADDAAITVSVAGGTDGRAALTSVPTMAGPRNYFLAVADATSGDVVGRSWACGDADAGCYDGTETVIGSHDGDPLLDAAPLSGEHVVLVSAGDRAGLGDARDVRAHVLPFDLTRGTGVEGIPLFTTREHGIATPRIRLLSVDTQPDGAGNVTLVLAALVENAGGQQAVWASGMRLCSAP